MEEIVTERIENPHNDPAEVLNDPEWIIQRATDLADALYEDLKNGHFTGSFNKVLQSRCLRILWLLAKYEKEYAPKPKYGYIPTAFKWIKSAVREEEDTLIYP